MAKFYPLGELGRKEAKDSPDGHAGSMEQVMPFFNQSFCAVMYQGREVRVMGMRRRKECLVSFPHASRYVTKEMTEYVVKGYVSDRKPLLGKYMLESAEDIPVSERNAIARLIKERLGIEARF